MTKMMLVQRVVLIILVITLSVFCSGCYFTDYRTNQKETLTIPYGHNLDEIIVKNGTVYDFKTHKRTLMEERNVPRKFPIIEVVEEKEQSLYDKKVYISKSIISIPLDK